MKVVAKTRNEQGSGASRRLRRTGFVPGIVYGGRSAATPVAIEHNPLYHALRVEAFHSSILDMEIDGTKERVLLRDVQWHAYKPQVLHIDFQRVAADEKITVRVPLHFRNQEISPAVKLSAGIIGHVVNDVEVICLPGDLPSFIEVDLANLEAGKAVHLSDIVFPAGVAPIVSAGDDPVIVTVTIPGAAEEEPAAAAPAAAPAAKK
ncbi:MAG: 50S ribosomal protein L25 [Burkholderiales bacterium]|nr:MAG: 50S ribosomal protein L25/general stress protein Ctc [Pseudomonadota bacterium]MCL4701772.1 50S ribosomal protein L25/general stress protein Ctc [Burkholderiaceae bacterium]MDL1908134.1 50S ribosomal protein L25/general stress protein Ctc [Betaproteobacteria bacterium PRO1]RIK89558.1 MAG: 50S ribosomal protein L25 [Burkholderiales bacterium]